jgi:hypothetical protein
MFAGISAALKSAAQNAILQAEKHLPDPESDVTILANRLLKALFLVKYVDTFKATPRNLAVLVYDRFGLDLNSLGKQVQEALTLLETQSYVQRNGNVYEYLTNEEQEIEKEIKNVDIDPSEVSAKLFKYLSADILKANKLKYAKNGQDFPFGYKLDDIVHGKHHELSIHFITPETNYSDEEILNQSMGLDELRVFLGRDKRLLGDLRLLLKTEKYTKQRTSSGATPSVLTILQNKQNHNVDREKELIERLRQAIGKAALIINAATIQSNSQDAVGRVTDGFQELVSRTYLNLKLLNGKVYSEQYVAEVINNDGKLFEGPDLSVLASPAAEVESWIKLQSNGSEQVTIKKLVSRFESKPHGWDLGSIEVVLAWLVAAGKVALSVDSNPVSRTESAALIRNTAKHPHARVSLQKAYDPARVNLFKNFCTEFFDDGSVPSDPTELAQFGKKGLSASRAELNSIVSASRYPFVGQLSSAIDLLDQVIDKPLDWYLGEFNLADELKEAKEDSIDPIKSFLNGQQAKIYDEAQQWLNENKSNLSYLPPGSADTVKKLLDDPNAFRGNKMNQLKVAKDELDGQLKDIATQKRHKVTAEIEDRKTEILGCAAYLHATPEAQRSAVRVIDQIVSRLAQESNIALILQTGTSFENERYPKLIEQLNASHQPTGTGPIAPKPMVAVGKIKAVGIAGILETEADVDRYLVALREALVATVNDGKGITL